MLIGRPMLANRDPEMLPKPWVKLANQPERAQDVPATLIRAIAIAIAVANMPCWASVFFDPAG